MTDFGTQLKRARKHNQITQKELAERLGVEQSAISNYEKNIRLPATSALMSIAEQLNVSVAYLLGGEVENEIEHEKNQYGLEPDLQQIRLDFLNDLLEKRFVEAFDRIKSIAPSSAGILEIYENIFEPTLHEVGNLWASGQLSIADEHIISDLIERALVTLSESRNDAILPTKGFSAAFMLPGAEMHQFPLKMSAEIFKSAGWTIYYIGKSIPLFSLQFFLENNTVDVLVLSVTLKEHLNSCESLIQLVKGMSLKHPPLILVGGSAITNENTAIQELGASHYLKSLQSLKEGMVPLEELLSKHQTPMEIS